MPFEGLLPGCAVGHCGFGLRGGRGGLGERGLLDDCDGFHMDGPARLVLFIVATMVVDNADFGTPPCVGVCSKKDETNESLRV